MFRVFGSKPLLALYFVSLLAFIFFINLPKAYAAGTGTSLTTSPVTLNLNVKAGTHAQETVRVHNNGTQPLQIQMQVKTFGAYGTSGEAAITNIPSINPAASYIHLSPSTFTAPPGTWTSVNVSISLPETASLGFYYAIVFQPVTNTALSHDTEVVKGANAILILIDTGSSNEHRQVQIASFSTTRGLYEYLPATFNVTFKNSGNIFLSPAGDIFISKHSNGSHSFATLEVNPGAGNVLPNSNRTFVETWSDGFPHFVPKIVNGNPVIVNQVPVEQLKWNTSQANKFRFGKYYALLAVDYNNGAHTILLNATLSFWVIPWKLMLIALVIVLIILTGLGFFVRAVIRRIKNRKHLRRR